MFGSNSYLGATIFPEAIQKAIEVTKEFGIGSGGVPLLTGTSIYQEELENLLLKYQEWMILSFFFWIYSQLRVISGLIRPNNLIIHDKLDHASLLDGTVMSGAKMIRYKHGDINDLERLLKDNSPQYPNGILVVTDGVFSMDGDIAKLPQILEITRKYDAILLVDEAHATGVIGDKGAGTLSHYGITDRKI